MARLDRRERERAEFRDEVLAAARQIVLEEGFDALTMRKIADAIEYAPGTIYLYFESRDAIAFELCKAGFDTFLAALLPAASVKDPLKRLRELGRLYVKFGLEHEETYRLIFMEDPKYASEAFQEQAETEDSPGKQALAILAELFIELREKKLLRSRADPMALAEMIWAGVHGIVSLKITYRHHPQTDAEELLEVMTDALVNGLVARTEPKKPRPVALKGRRE